MLEIDDGGMGMEKRIYKVGRNVVLEGGTGMGVGKED